MSYRLLWVAVVLVCLSASAQAGIIEICKVSDPPGSLADPFYFFTIGGEPGLGSILVPVDACSDPILLPDGQYDITETADATSTLESVFSFPEFALLNVALPDDTATVLLEGGADPTQEVTLSFVNTPADAAPEPATGWLLGSGLMMVWTLSRKPQRSPYRTALRYRTNSVVRRTLK